MSLLAFDWTTGVSSVFGVKLATTWYRDALFCSDGHHQFLVASNLIDIVIVVAMMWCGKWLHVTCLCAYVCVQVRTCVNDRARVHGGTCVSVCKHALE